MGLFTVIYILTHNVTSHHSLLKKASAFACLSRDLRRRLLSKRSEEEARLSQESESLLRELRESAQRERERQQNKLRSGKPPN